LITPQGCTFCISARPEPHSLRRYRSFSELEFNGASCASTYVPFVIIAGWRRTEISR
jgi:hypothetical protein